MKYTAFHGKKFKAVIRQPSSRVTEELDIELTSRASSQALYRAVTEFYTFFKRDTVSHVVKTAGYCKSLLGNIKSQLPDRFYFDVTRTHKEVINHVWTLLNSPEGSNPATSPQHGSRLRRGRSQHDPLPPIPTASRMGSSSTTAHSHHHHHHHPSGSRLQRAVSLQNRVRPNMSFQEAQQQLPPLPPFTQVSHSADGIVINNRAHLAPMAAATSMASVNPYTSPSLSEASDDASSTYSSSEYTTMSSRFGPGYSPNSHSQSLATPSERSDSYISAGESAHSTVSNTSSRNHPSLNSPPPLYSEVDPDPSSAPVMDFSDVPQSAGLSLVSPVPIISQGVFSFDTTCVLTRTRELEGELQRLRSAMTCRLCKQNPIGATFCPCGHTVCCFQCAQRLRTCWECDQSVHSVQRMLLASAV